MKKKVNFFAIFYILSVCLCFTRDFFGIYFLNLKFIVSALWLGYFIIYYTHSKNKSPNIIKYLCVMLAPYLILMLYTALIYLLQINSDFNIRIFTRQISSFLHLSLAYSFTIVGFYFFKKNVIKYIVIGAIISYFTFAIFPSILNGDLFLFIIGFFTGNIHEGKLLEVHDLTFGFGLLFLYYLFYKRKNAGKILMLLFMVILGWKRIIFVALFLCVLMYLLMTRNKSNAHIKRRIIGIGFTLASLLFIYIIKFDILKDIVNQLGIETSGRISFFDYASNFFEFNIFYPGKGYMWFYKYFEELYNSGFQLDGFGIAASIHSDVLCMYIEYGMILFISYILYYFIIVPRFLEKKFSLKTSCVFVTLFIYMFILYLTDNVANYFITQSIFIVLPLVFYDYDNNRNNVMYKGVKL